MGRPVDASFGDRSTIRLYELPMVSVSKTVAGRARRTSRTPMGVTRPALFILCFVLGAAAPGYAREVSLEEAIAFARLHNPDLLAASRELTIASGELTRANYWSQFNPLFVTEGIYRQRDHQSNSQDWRIGFSQELEIFGQKRLREKVAALGYREREATLADRLRLLSGAVNLTFYDALRGRARLALLTELEALDRRLREAAKARLAAGEISQIEANLAILRHGQSERAVIQGREQFRLLRSSLGRLTGGLAGTEPQPVGELRPRGLNARFETLVARAMHNRPDLVARELTISRLETEQAFNRRLALPNPTIALFGGHESNNEHPIGIVLGLPMPLFNRREAEATIIAGRTAQARDRLRATELDIEREVRDAFNQYVTAAEALRVYGEQVVGPARESFELLEKAFLAGKLDLLRLSVAEQQAFEARTGYLDALFSLIAAEVAIEIATGTSP